MPVVTALRATRRGRVAVHVDGEFLCAVSDAAVARWRLYKGRELDGYAVAQLLVDASAELVLADAYRLLGHRSRSEHELSRRLLAKGHAPDAVQAAVERLKQDGLLDDAAFARSFVADKRRLSGWGTQRIRRGLAEAGVSQGHAEAALAELVDAEAGDPEGAELERALLVLRKRAGSARPDEAAKRRAYQALLRRGFISGVAYAAVRAWSSALAAGQGEHGGPGDDAWGDDDQAGPED